MAIPLAAPALAGLKALLAKGGIGAAAKSLGGKAMAGKGMRMAGDALKGTGKFFLNNAGNTKTEVAMRLAPDLAFGVLGGAMTPGDLGDKVIAGTAQAAGGALGGIGMAGLAKKAGLNSGIQTLADMGGSIVGDQIGFQGGDALLRVKGGGMTPYERQAMEADAQYRAQLEQDLVTGKRMAGPVGAYALKLMNDPIAKSANDGWMSRFAMSNEGMEFNRAKMGGVPPQE